MNLRRTVVSVYVGSFFDSQKKHFFFTGAAVPAKGSLVCLTDPDFIGADPSLALRVSVCFMVFLSVVLTAMTEIIYRSGLKRKAPSKPQICLVQ